MSHPPGNVVIEMVDVEKYFGRQVVLNKINLQVVEGTTTVIVGASGQGKSLILKHMLGLVKPDLGQVLVYGRDLAKLRRRELRETRMNFGVLFQNGALFDSLNVFDNVALPLRERTGFSEKVIKDNVEEKLAMMELEGSEDKCPAQLSGGMQKRVGLARALVLNPRIIFFDEPTTGLDANKSNDVYRLFHRTQARLGYTAVIVSHDVPKIFKLADCVALLEGGVIPGCMSPEEFQLSDDPAIRAYVETTMGPLYSSEKEEAYGHETMET
jgi:phospholipid/cholesterol/gamma-HCH transport system ATP-binding protein